VVGSALVEEIANALEANENVTARVLSKAAALAKAVRSARNGNA
jgi:tryptophan synthase alpha chain